MLLTCFRRRQWQPTPVLLPGKSHGWRSLLGFSPWGHKESDTTGRLHFHFSLSCIGEGNGNPLQCSCLENPRDGRAWWAAVSGVTQSWTRLKWLSSSSSTWTIYKAFHENYYQDTFPFYFSHIFHTLDIPAVITVRKMELYIIVFIIILYIWFLSSFDSILRCWGITRHYNILFKNFIATTLLSTVWISSEQKSGWYPSEGGGYQSSALRKMDSGDIITQRLTKSVHCFRGFRISEFHKERKETR